MFRKLLLLPLIATLLLVGARPTEAFTAELLFEDSAEFDGWDYQNISRSTSNGITMFYPTSTVPVTMYMQKDVELPAGEFELRIDDYAKIADFGGELYFQVYDDNGKVMNRKQLPQEIENVNKEFSFELDVPNASTIEFVFENFDEQDFFEFSSVEIWQTDEYFVPGEFLFGPSFRHGPHKAWQQINVGDYSIYSNGVSELDDNPGTRFIGDGEAPKLRQDVVGFPETQLVLTVRDLYIHQADDTEEGSIEVAGQEAGYLQTIELGTYYDEIELNIDIEIFGEFQYIEIISQGSEDNDIYIGEVSLQGDGIIGAESYYGFELTFDGRNTTAEVDNVHGYGGDWEEHMTYARLTEPIIRKDGMNLYVIDEFVKEDERFYNYDLEPGDTYLRWSQLSNDQSFFFAWQRVQFFPKNYRNVDGSPQELDAPLARTLHYQGDLPLVLELYLPIEEPDVVREPIGDYPAALESLLTSLGMWNQRGFTLIFAATVVIVNLLLVVIKLPAFVYAVVNTTLVILFGILGFLPLWILWVVIPLAILTIMMSLMRRGGVEGE